jgi:hypothetical protein
METFEAGLDEMGLGLGPSFVVKDGWQQLHVAMRVKHNGSPNDDH